MPRSVHLFTFFDSIEFGPRQISRKFVFVQILMFFFPQRKSVPGRSARAHDAASACGSLKKTDLVRKCSETHMSSHSSDSCHIPPLSSHFVAFHHILNTWKKATRVHSRLFGIALLCLIAYCHHTSQSCHPEELHPGNGAAIFSSDNGSSKGAGENTHHCAGWRSSLGLLSRSWSSEVAGRVSKDSLSILGGTFSFSWASPMCQPRRAARALSLSEP